MPKAGAAAVEEARWTVPTLWAGETAVCIGGGPSLTVADVDTVRAHRARGRCRLIAINDAYRLAPDADVLYACDGAWWRWHHGVPDFQGLKVGGTRNAVDWPDVKLLELDGDLGLSLDPQKLRHGRNSGYQAINLAVLLGARQIVLLGYDMRVSPTGQTHWFGDHPNRVVSPYAKFLQTFPTLLEPLAAVGVEVINCTPDSALEVFPRRALGEVFADA